MSYQCLLRNLMDDKKTLLGVGPVTREIIDVCVDISKKEIPILLIASRRQVESESINKSYVVSTEYMGNININNLYKCRDHGGPWQGIDEHNISFTDAMKFAMKSYKSDIENGFKIIHIDPSVKKIHNVYDVIEELIRYCEKLGQDLEYEIGTEETNGIITDISSFDEFVSTCVDISVRICHKKPLFVVGQTGTYVRETKQAGLFDFENTVKLCNITHKYGLFFKEHNADYLSIEDYMIHRKSGIDAINIAPELGVLQTKILLDNIKNKELFDKFVKYVVDNKKWVKWLVNDDLSDIDKCLIAGHYHFNDNIMNDIWKEVDRDKIRTIWIQELKSRILEILEVLGI